MSIRYYPPPSAGGGGNGFTLPELFDLTEQDPDAATPGADIARLYARDDGAGETQLVVKLPSGNDVVIATDF